MSTIMVKLMEIKKSDAGITCIVLVEDCTEPIKMEFSEKDNLFYSDPLPAGYEWCAAHIRHAKNHLLCMMKNEDVPEQRTIMWC